MAIEVRAARAEDMEAVGKLAAKLVRLHESFDPDRFMHLDHPEIGYARFLRGELADKDTSVLVCVDEEGRVVGYSYARYEGRDYNALLDRAGKLHDIFIAEDARRRGAGRLLLDATLKALVDRGAERIVLETAVQNEGAQRLFEHAGFRTTMLEMTINPKR